MSQLWFTHQRSPLKFYQLQVIHWICAEVASSGFFGCAHFILFVVFHFILLVEFASNSTLYVSYEADLFSVSRAHLSLLIFAKFADSVLMLKAAGFLRTQRFHHLVWIYKVWNGTCYLLLQPCLVELVEIWWNWLRFCWDERFRQ